MMKTIHPSNLKEVPQGLVLDVRTPAEFEEVHIPGSILQPLSELNTSDIAGRAQGREVYLLCKSGNRARQAGEKLEKAGVQNLTLVEGGVTAWETAGLPVIKGKGIMSLERQVRIAAGSLVLLGVGLGFAVHKGFFGLAGFVGAGLVFAGITDTCGMGMMLARMPWNRGSCSSGSCRLASSQI